MIILRTVKHISSLNIVASILLFLTAILADIESLVPYVTTFMKVLLCNLGRQTEHGALEVGTGCAIAQNHIGHTNQHLTGVDSIFLGIDVYLQSSFYTDHIDVCIQLEILVEKQVLEISKYSNIVVGIVRTCIFCYIVCVKLVNLFFVFHIHVFSSFANVKQVAGNIES